MLQITSSAAREIERIQNNKQQSDSLLKLEIISGGCSGLFYELKIDSKKDDNLNSGDRFLEINGVQISISEKSWQYIENIKIDYAEDLMGGGFRFSNPQAKNVCGCGMSFAID